MKTGISEIFDHIQAVSEKRLIFGWLGKQDQQLLYSTAR